MANLTMASKMLKLRAQRRKYPKRMDLDIRGPRPKTEVLGDYRERAKGLAFGDGWIRLDNGQVVLESSVTTVNQHLSAKAEIDVDRINQKFEQPLSFTYMDNPAQTIRILFTIRKDSYRIEQKFKSRSIHRISIVYKSLDDCTFVLENEIVEWIDRLG